MPSWPSQCCCCRASAARHAHSVWPWSPSPGPRNGSPSCIGGQPWATGAAGRTAPAPGVREGPVRIRERYQTGGDPSAPKATIRGPAVVRELGVGPRAGTAAEGRRPRSRRPMHHTSSLPSETQQSALEWRSTPKESHMVQSLMGCLVWSATAKGTGPCWHPQAGLASEIPPTRLRPTSRLRRPGVRYGPHVALVAPPPLRERLSRVGVENPDRAHRGVSTTATQSSGPRRGSPAQSSALIPGTCQHPPVS